MVQNMNFRTPRMPLQDITPPTHRDLQYNLRNGRPHSFAIYEYEIEFYDVRRWMVLFGYSVSEAFRRIKRFRSTPPTFVLPDHEWDLVKVDMISEGYDREACAFLYNQQQKSNQAKNARRIARDALKELAQTRELLIDSEEFLQKLQLTIELEVLFSAAEETTIDPGSVYE